jgi:hypothetical protein
MPVVVAVGTVLVVLFLLWFAVGTQRNISRGNDVLRWLQAGLPQLGSRTTVRWYGSSAVQLDIAEAKAPFSSAQVNVVLEPRDLGLLWAWARQRGRRDFLILRGTLPEPPRFELEAGGRGWTGTDRLKRLDVDAWSTTTWEDTSGTVTVAHSGHDDLGVARRGWDDLAKVASSVWCLSVRNLAPHIEVHLQPPDLATGNADALVGAFRSLATKAARPPS